ncbi:MFS transporter [Phreatobacter sp.]|uniref:MFS transporter n=1 Tax=Phreatobacter sp. TaxID=1966341 RepID=UPI003F6FBEFD
MTDTAASSGTGAAALAGRREWIGLAVLALPCMLYSMDLTVLNLAVPQISADLRPTASQLLWIVDIYGFFVAGFLVTMGTLGDRIGRRRLLLIGAGAFGIASVFAAFATSPALLIIARALLGIAAATLAPSTLSLIRNMFPDPQERTFAIGVWIASFSAGAAIGPLVGGLMLSQFWWGSVFLINVPVMVLLLALGPVLLPEYRDGQAGRLDLPSVGLSLAAVLAVIFGIKRMAEHGPDALAAGATAGGLVLACLFVLRQRRLTDPLIDFRLFASPVFSAAVVVNLLGFSVAFGSFLLIAQHLQLVLGMSPLEAGLWTVPSALGFIAGSMVAPRLTRAFLPATVMVGGLLVAALGFVILTRIGGSWGLAAVVGGYIVISLGLAPVVTLTTDLIVGSAPPEKAGSASAISETASEFGGAVGIAVLGSIVTAIYRSAMASATPAAVPEAAAVAARDTLGAAIAVAGSLPEQVAAPLVAAARLAFTQSLETMALIAALVALFAAAVALVMLRRREPALP